MVRAVWILVTAALCLSNGRPLAAQANYETTRIAEGVYKFRWQNHNGFFVVAPTGVLAVDPISVAAAAQYAEEIKKVAPNAPLRAIVYSHEDADHATGAPALMSAMGVTVPIIAQRNAVPNLVRRADSDLPAPTVTYQEFMSLSLGDRVVELHYLGANHSDNSSIVYVPDVKVAFAVDFVSNDRLPFQQLPSWHFPDVFESVARLLDLDFETIVFGHGPDGNRDTIHRQISYYDALRTVVRRAVEAGWSEDRAASDVRLPEYADWGQYDAWLPLNVRGMYRWMSGG